MTQWLKWLCSQGILNLWLQQFNSIPEKWLIIYFLEILRFRTNCKNPNWNIVKTTFNKFFQYLQNSGLNCFWWTSILSKGSCSLKIHTKDIDTLKLDAISNKSFTLRVMSVKINYKFTNSWRKKGMSESISCCYEYLRWWWVDSFIIAVIVTLK